MFGGFSRYDQQEEIASRYHYPGTTVLINKENIRDASALADYEAEITYQRQLMLEKDMPVRGRFTKTHLMNIHEFIFQDVYYFAGKFRTESTYKVTNGVRTDFCRSEHIVSQLEELLHKLRSDNYLRGLERKLFIEKLADYMNDLNLIHPFPEGNGRAIREFIRVLALMAGYRICWSNGDKDELLDAMIRASQFDLGKLIQCLDIVITNC